MKPLLFLFLPSVLLAQGVVLQQTTVSGQQQALQQANEVNNLPPSSISPVGGQTGQVIVNEGPGYAPAWANLAVSTTAFSAGVGLNLTNTQFSLANTAVSPGSYTNTNLTVNQQGQITAASNGSSGGVSQITAGTNITISPPGGTGNVTINSSDSGSGSSVYPATATASFPLGLSVSTITLNGLSISTNTWVQNTNSLQSGAVFYVSSGTITGQISSGTTQGSGLSNCGDSHHALGWNNGSFFCQTITPELFLLGYGGDFLLGQGGKFALGG